MKVVFETDQLEELFLVPIEKMRGKQKFPLEVVKQYKKKVQILIALTRMEQLRQLRGLNFEYLKGNRKGECSIRLNDQYRLIFIPTEEDTIEVALIREISKHYD